VIRLVAGDMFDSGAEVLVVPVNCVGAMGAGVAHAARRRLRPESRTYRDLCAAGLVRPGYVHLVYPPQPRPRAVAFVATKDHWRDPSRLEWVDWCLKALADCLTQDHIRTCAVPALGCGHGGLDWADVELLVQRHLGPIETKCLVYAPREKEASR
jgi:O-acetyl-ADP-ribose deacetylase (regulator of RNase III)